jgi:hypothetical protein
LVACHLDAVRSALLEIVVGHASTRRIVTTDQLRPLSVVGSIRFTHDPSVACRSVIKETRQERRRRLARERLRRRERGADVTCQFLSPRRDPGFDHRPHARRRGPPRPAPRAAVHGVDGRIRDLSCRREQWRSDSIALLASLLAPSRETHCLKNEQKNSSQRGARVGGLVRYRYRAVFPRRLPSGDRAFPHNGAISILLRATRASV